MHLDDVHHKLLGMFDPRPQYFSKSIVMQVGGVCHGGVSTTCYQQKAMLLQKHRDANRSCIVILFRSITVRDWCNCPESGLFSHQDPTLGAPGLGRCVDKVSFRPGGGALSRASAPRLHLTCELQIHAWMASLALTSISRGRLSSARFCKRMSDMQTIDVRAIRSPCRPIRIV